MSKRPAVHGARPHQNAGKGRCLAVDEAFLPRSSLPACRGCGSSKLCGASVMAGMSGALHGAARHCMSKHRPQADKPVCGCRSRGRTLSAANAPCWPCICRFAGLQVCRFAGLQVCRFAALRLCTFCTFAPAEAWEIQYRQLRLGRRSSSVPSCNKIAQRADTGRCACLSVLWCDLLVTATGYANALFRQSHVRDNS